MPSVFAHRGFSGKYPENTLLAFEKALETGCGGIELDVQLSSDGEPVILHDETLDRTTNGTGFVKDFTAFELRKLRIKDEFRNRKSQEHIPTLREYFELIRGTGIITNIELKTGVFEYPGIEEKVISLVREFKLENSVQYSSFNHYSLLRCREIESDAYYGFLIYSWLIGAGDYVKRMRGTSINACSEYLSQEIVNEIHDHGIIAQAYTPNEPALMRWLCQNNVDVLISNYPDLAMEVVLQHEQKNCD